MFIRRTSIKSRSSGEPYYTYRLVESLRLEGKVRQRTLLNLGRHFEVPRAQWLALAQRIEQLLSGQCDALALDLDPQFEAQAQRYSAMLVHANARTQGPAPGTVDYQSVDVNSLALIRPRSVAVEHVGLAALRRLGLDTQLELLGFNGPQRAAAIGTIIARMTAPGSELSTHRWLQTRSGLGELIDHEYAKMNLMQLYRVSDQLLKHKVALEQFLYSAERNLFEFDEVITLYDLTNTYFEGRGAGNANAAYGKSKEKRTDCPLVTLALVLDGSGFIKRSEVFAGNVSEARTLAQMVGKLRTKDTRPAPTVVLDAGIATEQNIAWLVEQHYRYVVVSRKRHREFDPHAAVVIRDEPLRIQAQRVVDPETGEVHLYCHSSAREKKEHAIQTLATQRFEAALKQLAEGLHKKRTLKRYDKILERLGRLRQKYARVAQYYDITVTEEPTSGNAGAIEWQRTQAIEDTLPGVYCLRTNHDQWDEATLWRTYTMLTDLEAVFRCLKSELGLRPVFHHKTDRVRGHLFISVLAYHLVHTLRYQLKARGIHLSWDRLRQELDGQDRVTIEMQRADGKTLHIRKATRPEPRQQVIYDALEIPHHPGKTEKTII